MAWREVAPAAKGIYGKGDDFKIWFGIQKKQCVCGFFFLSSARAHKGTKMTEETAGNLFVVLVLFGFETGQ